MIRILGMVIGIFCTATVLTLSLALLLAWNQGTLNDESRQEIVAILKGQTRPSELKNEDDSASEMPSYAQIAQMRTGRILGLSTRESELAVLKQAMDDQANFVLNERRQLAQIRKSFQEELTKEREQITSESVTQARNILLKMDPESAVEKLLALEPREAVVLMRGLPGKDAARILDQFRQRIAGKDPDIRLEKAEEIYKAIYRGDPLIDSVDSAQRAVDSLGSGQTETR